MTDNTLHIFMAFIDCLPVGSPTTVRKHRHPQGSRNRQGAPLGATVGTTAPCLAYESARRFALRCMIASFPTDASVGILAKRNERRFHVF
jgi:hypothetical protein